MKRFFTCCALLLTLSLVGCGGDDYDDSAIKAEIADLEQRLSTAETVLKAYNNALFIKSVTTTSNGYVITFSDGSKATITNGKDGQNGQNGQNGKDGDTWIKEVKVSDREVTFTMTDGTTFSIPLSTLVGNIQNLSFVPDYSDGKATVTYTTASDAELKMRFVLSPAELTADVAAKWSELLAVEAVLTATRAAEPIALAVTACEADAAKGMLSITATASGLGADFFANGCSAAAALKVADGVTTYTSEYIPLVAETAPIPTNELWYTSYNGAVVAPKSPSALGVSIVSNSYENGKGVLTFSGDLTTIGDSAFSGCTALTSVMLPESVTTIDKRAFRSCTKLADVTIPASVTTIGDYAFAQSALQTVSILGKPTIGQYAFTNCKNSYGVYTLSAFYGPLATADNRALVVDGVLMAYAAASGNEYVVPAGVKSIGATAFANCNDITSITLPQGVETIETYAFYYCFALNTINIPEGVKSIGQYAFMGCRGFSELTLPSTLTKLEAGAFRGASVMTTLILHATTPPSLYSGVFNGCSALTEIRVPASAVTTYKEHEDWCTYADMIVAQ